MGSTIEKNIIENKIDNIEKVVAASYHLLKRIDSKLDNNSVNTSMAIDVLKEKVNKIEGVTSEIGQTITLKRVYSGEEIMNLRERGLSLRQIANVTGLTLAQVRYKLKKLQEEILEKEVII